jgi:anti-sigma regulatory factor (Ser/Thr protein kinase)
MAALFGTRDSFVLEQSRDAPARARLLVAAALETWGVASDFPDVALITSELVTNAVVHAAGDVALTARPYELFAPHRGLRPLG